MIYLKQILTSLALVLVTSLQAKENVTIVYAFSPADTMSQYSRTLVEEANRIQDKYLFLFDTKPGAGNAVAANYVKTNPNHILATSSAFFIRPVLYPTQSYDLNEFRPLLPQCDSPMGVASVKYRSWDDVPRDRPVTIGVSGLGVTTHLVALQIASKYPNMNIVPFKSTNDSIVAAVGGHMDLTVGFINDLYAWTGKEIKENQRMSVLGVTGSKKIKQTSPFVQQGFPSILSSMDAPHHLVVPKTISDVKFNEWRDILFKASKAKSVVQSCLLDQGAPLNSISDTQINTWYDKQIDTWKSLSQGVKIE